MIDEMIADLSDPRLRVLYDALLGRRVPTTDEKGVLVAVGMDISRCMESGDREIKLPHPAFVLKVGLVMERAWQIDEEGVKKRLRSYVEEIEREQEKREDRG